MTRLTKCPGERCPDKDTCWRYLAPTQGPMQSWAFFERKLRQAQGDDCYIPHHPETLTCSNSRSD